MKKIAIIFMCLSLFLPVTVFAGAPETPPDVSKYIPNKNVNIDSKVVVFPKKTVPKVSGKPNPYYFLGYLALTTLLDGKVDELMEPVNEKLNQFDQDAGLWMNENVDPIFENAYDFYFNENTGVFNFDKGLSGEALERFNQEYGYKDLDRIHRINSNISTVGNVYDGAVLAMKESGLFNNFKLEYGVDAFSDMPVVNAQRLYVDSADKKSQYVISSSVIWDQIIPYYNHFDHFSVQNVNIPNFYFTFFFQRPNQEWGYGRVTLTERGWSYYQGSSLGNDSFASFADVQKRIAELGFSKIDYIGAVTYTAGDFYENILFEDYLPDHTTTFENNFIKENEDNTDLIDFNILGNYNTATGDLETPEIVEIDDEVFYEVLKPNPNFNPEIEEDALNNPETIPEIIPVSNPDAEPVPLYVPNPELDTNPDTDPETNPDTDPVPSPDDFSVPSTGAPSLNLTPLTMTGDDFTRKFPFSIPWDLIRQFDVFNVEPEAPIFSIDKNLFTIGTMSFPIKFDIDLSDFDLIAAIARWAFLIAFDVAIIMSVRRFMPE